MVRVDINPAVLKWAISRTGIPIAQLKSKPDFKLVEEWLQGTVKPTLT